MTQEQIQKAHAALKADPGIGRRKLIKACGCTAYAAARFLKRVYTCTPAPEATPELPLGPAAKARTSVTGHVLKDVRVSFTKPNEGLKHRLFGLRQGIGFPVTALARDWCVSEENLKKQARRYDALIWVETNPEKATWEFCVAHPDTAAKYRKENHG